ncbi:MAG: DVU0150 family protein [Thermodesulfobacteriota bacterium]
MQAFWKKIYVLAGLALVWVPKLAIAAGEKADMIVIVADTRRLTGWEAWWANLYNESHAYFTALTVITIPVVGLILGLLADVVMKHIGIDLSSRELAEH